MKKVGIELVLLFAAGALLLSFPVLAIFNRSTTVAGVPVLYVYLFGVWAAWIGLVFTLARRPWDDEG